MTEISNDSGNWSFEWFLSSLVKAKVKQNNEDFNEHLTPDSFVDFENTFTFSYKNWRAYFMLHLTLF